MKIFVNLLILLSSVFALSKSWVKYSNSFRIDKIFKTQEIADYYHVKESSNVDISKILDQKFTFLDKGRQSFVFESEDKKYVLKLIRYHRYFKPFWSDYFNFFSFGRNYTSKIENETQILFDQTMKSYLLAYEHLKEETGTIFVHLNQNTNLKKKLIIFDKFNRQYEIDLNDIGFILQKKADLFIPNIAQMKDDIFAVKNMLSSFFLNLNSMYEKKIYNDDRHVLNNLGIDGGRVLEFDIGRLKYKEDLLKKEIYAKEIVYYTTYLRKWLSKNIPEALPFFEIKIQELIDEKK